MEDTREAYDRMIEEQLVTVFPDDGLILLKIKKSSWNKVGGFVAFMRRENVELAFKCSENKYIYMNKLIKFCEKKYDRSFEIDLINIEA